MSFKLKAEGLNNGANVSEELPPAKPDDAPHYKEGVLETVFPTYLADKVLPEWIKKIDTTEVTMVDIGCGSDATWATVMSKAAAKVPEKQVKVIGLDPDKNAI